MVFLYFSTFQNQELPMRWSILLRVLGFLYFENADNTLCWLFGRIHKAKCNTTNLNVVAILHKYLHITLLLLLLPQPTLRSQTQLQPNYFLRETLTLLSIRTYILFHSQANSLPLQYHQTITDFTIVTFTQRHNINNNSAHVTFSFNPFSVLLHRTTNISIQWTMLCTIIFSIRRGNWGTCVIIKQNRYELGQSLYISLMAMHNPVTVPNNSP